MLVQDNREKIAQELEDAAVRVRSSTSTPIGVGIVIYLADDDNGQVHTSYVGAGLLGLMAGCSILSRRLDEAALSFNDAAGESAR